MTIINRLPDNITNARAISDLNQVSLNIERDYEYITSGNLFRTYKDSGINTSRILSIEDTLSSIESYIQTENTVMERLKKMEVVISQINDIASEFNVRLTKSTSYGITDSSFQSYCQDQLNLVQSLLNIKDTSGSYLFGGYQTNVQPVDLSLIGVPPAGSPINYGYYQGTDDILSAYITQDVNLEYGVTADNPGFGNLIQALKIGAATLPSNDLNSILRTDAMPQMEQAISLIPSVLEDIGTSMNSVELAQQRQSANKEVTQGILSDLEDADPVASMINLNKNQVALQFSILAHKEISNNLKELLYALKS